MTTRSTPLRRLLLGIGGEVASGGERGWGEHGGRGSKVGVG